MNFSVQLFPSLQSLVGGTGTVWEVSHPYPLNSTPMSQSYYVDPQILAGLDHDRLWRALTIVAQVIAKDCECFEAEVACPKAGMDDTKRSGFLPEDSMRRESFIDQVVEWLRDCVECTEVVLILATKCQKDGDSQVKFRYHEEPHRWCICVTPAELMEIHASLRASALPTGLFQEHDEPKFAIHPQFAAI